MMSNIHAEMRVWRKHLRESRHIDCVSCHRSFMKQKPDSDDGIKNHLCSDCQMMENGW